MLHQLVRPALLLFSLTLPLWVLFRAIVIVHNKRSNATFFSLNRELLLLLFYIYVTCILIFTIVPIPLVRQNNTRPHPLNFIPFVYTIKEFIASLSPAAIYLRKPVLENIIGNVVLFFPLGIFLPLLSGKNNSLKKVILVSFLFSFSIESIQFISRQFGIYRFVDIDDIILNITGTVLGFVITRRFFSKKYSLL